MTPAFRSLSASTPARKLARIDTQRQDVDARPIEAGVQAIAQDDLLRLLARLLEHGAALPPPSWIVEARAITKVRAPPGQQVGSGHLKNIARLQRPDRIEIQARVVPSCER